MRTIFFIFIVTLFSSCKESQIDVKKEVIVETNSASDRISFEMADFIGQLEMQKGQYSLDFNIQLDTLPEEFYSETQAKSINISCILPKSVVFLSNKISHFTELETFSLSKSGIEVLPDEIGSLTSLKLLRISGGGRLSTLPESISRLSNLE